ncbi:MAG: hypothetical protein HYZ91_05835 [Candidatus Omnitrophica bacterium]|nr:hypothetical protein [Candidatus Omnitrophota bacterium]
MSLRVIQTQLGAELSGDPETVILGVNALEAAAPVNWPLPSARSSSAGPQGRRAWPPYRDDSGRWRALPH